MERKHQWARGVQKVGRFQAVWGLTATLFPGAVGGLQVRREAGVGHAHVFLKASCFTCLKSHLFRVSSRAADARLLLLALLLSFLSNRGVLARPRAQMSCEGALTRREGKGNEFFRPDGDVISQRCAHVCTAPPSSPYSFNVKRFTEFCTGRFIIQPQTNVNSFVRKAYTLRYFGGFLF